MSIMNLKNPYDRVELTTAVLMEPYVPHELEKWLPWNSEGVTTRTVFVEIDSNGSLSLIDEANPRAGKREYADDTDRTGYTVRIPYYPQWDALIAEATQGVRAFGSTTDATAYLIELAKKVEMQKKKNALQREFIRAGALQSIIYKKDGNVSQNLHQLAGTTANTHEFDLDDPTTDVIAELTEAKEKLEDELGAYQGLANGYILIAGKEYHRKISRHASIQKAFALWSASGAVGNLGSALRDDLRAVFPITTDIDLRSYSKGKIGNTHFLDPNKALLCPILPGMYQTRNAPGTGKSAVNTIGLPEYAQIEPLGFDKGDELHMEMATVSYLERTRGVVELTSA
jgi:hypothetical protein